jgi:GNAT superfamily N-acetyltransferase
MSNINNNTVWESKFPTEPDNNINDWFSWQNRFKEFGTPGYEKVTFPVKVSNTDLPIDVTFTTYRNEDGILLAVHGCYYDESNIRHPFLMTVHPNHRGKGIATQVALHLEQEFIAQEGPKYGFTPEEFAAMPRAERAALVVPDMYKATLVNNAGAGFLNNLVDQFYNK